MRDIGWLTAGTVAICTIAVCMVLADVFGKSGMERCSASCGPGRFKVWTQERPGTPEKCECSSFSGGSMDCSQKGDGGFIECRVLEVR